MLIEAILLDVLVVCILGGGLAWLLLHVTHVGRQIRQHWNAERIRERVRYTCPVHGEIDPALAVPGRGGHTCPTCLHTQLLKEHKRHA